MFVDLYQFLCYTLDTLAIIIVCVKGFMFQMRGNYINNPSSETIARKPRSAGYFQFDRDPVNFHAQRTNSRETNKQA